MVVKRTVIKRNLSTSFQLIRPIIQKIIEKEVVKPVLIKVVFVLY